MKREPRLERLTAASRSLRGQLEQLDGAELAALRDLLERVLEPDVIGAAGVRELEERLLS